MNVVYTDFSVFCKDDKNGYELLQPNFIENNNEIRIKTPARNIDLYKGWMGDLLYRAGNGIDVSDDSYTDTIVEELYKDVLLIKINVIFKNNNDFDWEYVFLKK